MTGILTFHWADDYGAMLQSYGLKHTLEAMGEQVEIVPYAPVKLTGRYWWCTLSAREHRGKIRYRFRRSNWRRNRAIGWDFWRRKENMRRFRRQYLTEQRPIYTAKKISLEKYNQVFVGSDQIWNPVITVDLDDAYMGNVGKKGDCRLISYAASFGREDLPEPYREKFARCVTENFAAVSVRERCTVPFTQQLLHREVTDVLDPVLLVEKEEWEKIAKPPSKEGYILIYWTERNEQLLQYACTLASELHKEIVQVSYLGGKKSYWDLCVAGGPAEFVGYVRNAAYVLTNSFHGTAFSVLLEKPFFSFCHSSANTRVADLLQKLGLSSRMKRPMDRLEINSPIDWDEVKKCLETERAHSKKFLLDHVRG